MATKKVRRIRSCVSVQRHATHHLHVGAVLCVGWSNGAGFTLYRVADIPLAQRDSCTVCGGTGVVDGGNFCRECTDDSHAFEQLGDYEYVDGGCVQRGVSNGEEIVS